MDNNVYSNPFTGPFASPLSNLMHYQKVLSEQIDRESRWLLNPFTDRHSSMVRAKQAIDAYLRKALVFK